MTTSGAAGNPTRQEHINQAAHNENLASSLQNTVHTDWAVTAFFYAALHLFDAYMVSQGRIKAHQKRVSFMFRSPDFSSVAGHYQELLDRSQDARYNCVRFNPAFVQRLVSSDFDPFKFQTRKLLGI